MNDSISGNRPASSIPWAGVVCGVIAAVGYTSAHTFLRALSLTSDPAWVSCVKASCTVLIFGPWLIWLATRNKFVMPPASSVAVLVLAGFFVQLGGNLAYQISLGGIGLALTVPLMMGSMIVSTGLIGRWILGEALSRRMVVALSVLMLSIIILSMGVHRGAGPAVEPASESNYLLSSAMASALLACFLACLSGVAYSLLGIAIRWTTRRSSISLATPMVIVGACGVVSLGTVAFATQGPHLLFTTAGSEWRAMLLAGLSNSTAFLALTFALRVLPVIYVNAINFSQIAMAALIGIALFAEPVSGYLLLGLITMLMGFGLMTKQRLARKAGLEPLVKYESPVRDAS